ncbi:MAG: fliD [Chlamydiales bacterium]|jgi:flagellar hook-associated protein 2|nr:fliD [Chlamydiales bacterium]
MVDEVGSGKIRMGGMTSGFDTKGIIDQILAVKQKDIKKIEDKQALNLDKIQQWQGLSKTLESLADTVKVLKGDQASSNSLLGSLGATSSDETIFTATASSGALAGTYAVVTSTLAKPHCIYSNQQSSSFANLTPGTVKINGATISFSGIGESLQDMADAINNGTFTSGSEVTAQVIANRLVLSTKVTGASQFIHGTPATNFTVPGDDPDGILQSLGIINAAGTILPANTATSGTDFAGSIGGVSISNSSNTLTSALTGVTLIAKSTGTATLTIAPNTSKIVQAVTSFVESYNETLNLVKTLREFKMNEEDKTGPFTSDPLLKEIYSELRRMTTFGVHMGSCNWSWNKTTKAATSSTIQNPAAAGATSIDITGLNPQVNGNETLAEGDRFIIAGDNDPVTGNPNIYTLVTSSNITGAGTASIFISPPLKNPVAAGAVAKLDIASISSIGLNVGGMTGGGIGGEIKIDQSKLETSINTNFELVQRIFIKNDPEQLVTTVLTDYDKIVQPQHLGIANRLYNWLDSHIRVGLSIERTRSISSTKIPSIKNENIRLQEQIYDKKVKMAREEEALVKKFSEMENAMAKGQGAGQVLSGLTSPGK